MKTETTVPVTVDVPLSFLKKVEAMEKKFGMNLHPLLGEAMLAQCVGVLDEDEDAWLGLYVFPSRKAAQHYTDVKFEECREPISEHHYPLRFREGGKVREEVFFAPGAKKASDTCRRLKARYDAALQRAAEVKLALMGVDAAHAT